MDARERGLKQLLAKNDPNLAFVAPTLIFGPPPKKKKYLLAFRIYLKSLNQQLLWFKPWYISHHKRVFSASYAYIRWQFEKNWKTVYPFG